MSNLIENIASNDLVKAKKIFEARMDEIRDQKLYEAKRCIAAELDEAVGGKTIKQMADLRARGYRPAHEVLGHLISRKLEPIPGTIHDTSRSKKTKQEPEEKSEEKPLSKAKIKAKLKAHTKTVKGLSTKINKKSKPRGKLKPIKVRNVSEETLDELNKGNPIGRKVAAATLRVGRKFGGREFGKGYFAAKKSYQQQQSQIDTDKEALKTAGAEPSQPKTDTPSSRRTFGKMVKQNVNTFAGRNKDATFVTKDHEGQTGRVLRTVVKGLAAMRNTGD